VVFNGDSRPASVDQPGASLLPKVIVRNPTAQYRQGQALRKESGATLAVSVDLMVPKGAEMSRAR